MSYGVPLGEVFVERPAQGRPHAGKVLAVIQAHVDDIPFTCAGTVAKLIDEGYAAYIFQTTNDEKGGPTPSIGESILGNERDLDELAKVFGFKGVFNLGYRNHLMDGESPLEIRCRLIFLFRLLKVDTVITFNPWGHWEENPDHWVTGAAVEAAAWMAATDKDYPEHFAAGLKPHRVRERYYWVMREGQPYNRVVDIGPWIEKTVASFSVCKHKGPAGYAGRRLKARLAAKGLRLPALDGSDEDADGAYVRLFLLEPFAKLGKLYGLDYAEAFYYMGPEDWSSKIEEYIAKNAVPLSSLK